MPFPDNGLGFRPATPKSDNDAWIAACALTYELTLVTDDDDFHGIQGLNIISHYSEGRN